MAKMIMVTGSSPDEYCAMFWCPGCDEGHGISEKWQFNGDAESPTVSPSILTYQNDPSKRCHSFVRNGKIEFLSDCHHELAGQTVEIPDWEVEFNKWASS